MKTNKIYSIGYIYKITNIKNNKAYIGQTTKTVEDRWLKHQRESIGAKARLDTKFARALRKDGVDNFKVETLEILKDCTKQELTNREHYWVYFYNTIENGYNVQDPLVSSGGNTYAGKTAEELAEIGKKISEGKKGKLNPHAHAVKCLNVETGEIIHFDTAEAATSYFSYSNHQFVTRRCLNEIKSLFQGKYMFAYEEDDFNLVDITKGVNHAKRRPITVINTATNESQKFESFTTAEKFIGWKRGRLQKLVASNKLEFQNYKFILD